MCSNVLIHGQRLGLHMFCVCTSSRAEHMRVSPELHPVFSAGELSLHQHWPWRAADQRWPCSTGACIALVSAGRLAESQKEAQSDGKRKQRRMKGKLRMRQGNTMFKNWSLHVLLITDNSWKNQHKKVHGCKKGM